MSVLSTKEQFEIYKLLRAEIEENARGLNSKLTWITGMVTAILGGTLAASLGADSLFEHTLLLSGPVLLISSTWKGKTALTRQYRLYLERITMAAKIEDLLGLSDSLDVDATNWSREPLIPRRWKADRALFNSPDDWIDAKINDGFMSWTSHLLHTVQVLALLQFLVMLYHIFANFLLK